MEILVFLSIYIFCSIVFTSIGVYSLKRKTPMHFWSGTTVDPKSISDVTAYNKANGIMWITYGLLYTILGIIHYFTDNSFIFFTLVFLPTGGIIFLVLSYNAIYKKYKI